MRIEQHYSERAGRSVPMDLEWGKDGRSGELYILQARPETVHSQQRAAHLELFRMRGKSRLLAHGKSVGSRVATGLARVIHGPEDLVTFRDGEVLVAPMTDPDWEPVMKRASAIVTDHGGRTCHAAIVSRELGVPCVVGTSSASTTIEPGATITDERLARRLALLRPGLSRRLCAECAALKRVREELGLRNVKLMIPFCRTLKEADLVLAELAKNGLARGSGGLEVYVMCEIPNNVILAEQFSERFGGFSIGSNDLTQLTLGVDRDSELLTHVFDEDDPGVVAMIRMVVEKAHRKGRKVGLCGQAPSDDPAFARLLADIGLDSISVTSDALPKMVQALAEPSPTRVARRTEDQTGLVS